MDMVSTLGELLSRELGDHPLPRSASQYYVILDSTVRGPFLPLYLSNYAGNVLPPSENDKTNKVEGGKEGEASVLSPSLSAPSSRSCFRPYRWTDAFTYKITDTVKLVGSTIACSPSPHVVSESSLTNVLFLLSCCPSTCCFVFVSFYCVVLLTSDVGPFSALVCYLFIVIPCPCHGCSGARHHSTNCKN